MFESYITNKNEALEAAAHIAESAAIEQFIARDLQLQKDIDNLEHGTFKIALIAPFSAGKSTFINSLIGRDILSMDITAETSVITKIVYSETIGACIQYRDGHVENYPETKEARLTADELKELLVRKTTVKGENTEDNIEEVTVYYPIEMCKDQVELIDTPGLFARHEKHKAITEKILPKANAIIFMIDPDSVGETHFTEVIQSYVRNAENSNLEEKGKHIFFVINKIDHFSKEDIAKARKELEEVLEEIIPQPQIYGVSAYYAMNAKMFQSGAIGIESIQKNRKISIPDPEDPEYSLSGRSLGEEHIENIIAESGIRTLEKGLERYLETKHEYLIENLYGKMENIIHQSIENKRQELDTLINIKEQDKERYEQQIKSLSAEIDEIQFREKRSIEQEITARLIGTNGIVQEISPGLEEHIRKAGQKMKNNFYRKWNSDRIALNQTNGERIIIQLTDSLETDLNILGREITKNTFIDLNKKLTETISQIEKNVEGMKLKLENAELMQLGKTLGSMDSYNLDQIMSSITSEIEDNFADTIVTVASTISGKVSIAEKDNTSQTEREGFLYSVKRFFTGTAEYKTEFDLYGYKASINQIIMEMNDEINSAIQEVETSIKVLLEKPMRDIATKLRNEVASIITALVNNRQKLINNLIVAMKANESEAKVAITKLLEEMDELSQLLDSIQTTEQKEIEA